MQLAYLSQHSGPTAVSLAELSDLHLLCGFRDWTALALERFLGSPGVDCLTASIKGDCVGFLLYRAAGDETEIISFGVRPACRRRGIAEALLAKTLSDAPSLCCAWFLEVAVDNTAAQALYERHGFTQAGRRPEYYGRGENRIDALVLRLQRADPA
jgi:ribosomal-protein-alanine N-acetyltransferase